MKLELKLRSHLQPDLHCVFCQDERRLLIGGNYWPQKFRKKSLFKKQKKNSINEKIYQCGCLRVCVCEKNRILGDHSSQNEMCKYELIVRDLFDCSKQIDQNIQLDAEIFISQDGTVRLNVALSQICFGQWQGFAERIQNNKVDRFVNVVRKKEDKQFNKYLEKELKILESLPDGLYQEITFYLKKYNQANYQFKSQNPMQVTIEEIQIKNINFLKFSNICFEYLRNIPKEMMYVYNIGRINPATKDFEIIHSGYSSSYLDLLGIDYCSLSSLLLRRKSVDLVQNPVDITRISGHSLNWMFKRKEDPNYQSTGTGQVDIKYECDQISCRIVTFDGFSLTLYQTCRLIPIQENDFGNFFLVYDLKIDNNELLGLISYRTRLISSSSNLQMEDFLKYQLSLLFEDVEYSVLSQNFIEKYYSKEMISLSFLNPNLTNNQQGQWYRIKSTNA